MDDTPNIRSVWLTRLRKVTHAAFTVFYEIYSTEDITFTLKLRPFFESLRETIWKIVLYLENDCTIYTVHNSVSRNFTSSIETITATRIFLVKGKPRNPCDTDNMCAQFLYVQIVCFLSFVADQPAFNR